MMHVAIVPHPAYGHVNPTLRTACELLARGHEVEYALPERFADAVESTGATFQRLDDALDIMAKMHEHRFQPGSFDEQNRDGKQQDRERHEKTGLAMMGPPDAASMAVNRIVAANPDVIVFDPICLWGRRASEQLDAVSVAFYSSFAVREESLQLNDGISFGQEEGPNEDASLPDPITDALEAHGVSDPSLADFLGVNVDADLSIVSIPRVFQPNIDEYGDDYHFVGPMIRSGEDEQDAGLALDRLVDRQSVYVSLGTIVHGDRAFFEACIDAFGETDWEVVMKAKENAEQLDSESPENVSVRRRVPQLTVLEQVDVFVTHGGMNSTMEALSFNTPLVVVPQAADQNIVAERVIDLGLGCVLDPKTLTADDLFDAVETVHSDPYCETVESFQATLREAGGAERVADAIEQFGER